MLSLFKRTIGVRCSVTYEDFILTMHPILVLIEEVSKKMDKDQECNFCGKKYVTQKVLKLHVSKKHAAESMEGKKKIKCGFCELEFAERRLLPKPKSKLKKTSNSQA